MKLPISPPLGRLIVIWIGVSGVIAGGTAAAEKPIDFRRDVQPILSRSCFTCHGPDEGTRETDLRFDYPESLFGELDSGTRAVVPGEPQKSELLARITNDDASLRMPPEGGQPLTADQVDTIRDWIQQGAAYSGHWAFQPPVSPVVPSVQDTAWPQNAIDHFVLARLESDGVLPSPPADRPTLLRRLSFDLRGIPPTPEEADRFVADRSPDAYQRLVERMLAAPQFGERWGKHWLDLARYADSDGYLGDKLRPHAHLYRDWVIDAINRDLSLDRFTIEQLAGDLLPDATLDQKIATGFHRNAMKNTEAGADRELDRVNRTVNYVSTTGTVWLGMTIGCAECHTHKYDPISHHEFYRLYAFFDNVEDRDLAVPNAAEAAEYEKTASKTASSTTSKAATMAEAGGDQRRTTRVHLRGDFRSPGDQVGPGTPEILHPLNQRGEHPDRLDLAHWLIDPANPLTHRTTVNRIWKHLFGSGLVATPDNFGITGESPSHPELLDYLALELVRRGWSRKAIIRLIVHSATYQQQSHARPELRDTDPQNRSLARQNRFRLEAEVVRDAALSVGGLLNCRIGGPSIRPPLDARVTNYSRNTAWPVSPGAEKYRRGLYVLFRRNTPYSMLITFDAPDTSVACAQRERTHSPLQALTLLNDPVFHECAQGFGRDLMRLAGDEPIDWVIAAFRRALTRLPTEAELERLIALYDQQRQAFAELPPSELLSLIGEPLADPGDHTGLADQAARLIVARSLINVNEFITRE